MACFWAIGLTLSRAASLTLQWDPSTDGAAVKYRLYGGADPSFLSPIAEIAAPATKLTITNLVRGQLSLFAVTVVTDEGLESDLSDPIAFIPNSIPTASNLNISGLQDQTASVSLQGVDADRDALLYFVQTLPANGTLSGVAPFLKYTPKPNFFGSDKFTYIVSDGLASSLAATVNITVQPINKPPTLNPLPFPVVLNALTLNEDAPMQTIALSGITSGATFEAQPLKVSVSISGLAVIPSATVSYVSPSTTGSISFKPAANAFGTSWITVTVDDGQPTNNTTYLRFAVTVNPVNDPPTLNPIANVTLNQGAAVQTISLTGITSGAANEADTLTLAAISSNPDLIPSPVISYVSPNTSGSLTFTPTPGANGSATITVMVNDGGASNNIVARSFTVTVNPPAPAISNLTALAGDARSLILSWNTDQSATCSADYGLTSALGLTSSVTTFGATHSLTLSNLRPATVYYVRVKATAAGGTTFSTIGSASTEAVRVLLLGAESGALVAPMSLIASSGAQNGKYISSAAAGSGTAQFDVNAGSGLNYRVWSRVSVPAGGGSFYISLDGGPESLVQLSDDGTGSWRWLLLGGMNASPTNCLLLPMTAGAHRIVIRNGAANTGIDQLGLVNDPQWQPILPTTQPVLVATTSLLGTADLSWQLNAGNAENVAIESSLDGINFVPLTVIPATGSTLRVANLLGLIPYYFRVFAFNSVDRTAYSKPALARSN